MNSIINLLGIFKKINTILDKRQKKKLVFVMLITIVAAFMELLGVSVILPFVEAITNNEQLMDEWYFRVIRDMFGAETKGEIIIAVSLVIVLVYLVKNIYMVYARYVNYDFSSRVSMELSLKMLNSFMSKPYEKLINYNSAEVIRGCTYDILSVYEILQFLIEIIAEVLSIVFILILLLKTDYFIAISTSLVMVMIMLFMAFVFKPVFKRIGKEYLQVYVKLDKTIFQMINGIKEIYVTKREKQFYDEYRGYADQERLIKRKRDVINSSPDRITEAVCVSCIILLLSFRIRYLANSADFIPDMSVFAMAAFKVFPSIGKITSRVNAIVYRNAALDNVYGNVVETGCFDNTEHDEGLSGTVKFGRVIPFTFNDAIEFRNVSFGYDNIDRVILDDISMTIKKGQSVGIIGESGAGKTTLVDLLLGLLKPQKGEITIDGVPLSQIRNEWGRIVSYVPQTVFILDASVKDNILFGMKLESTDDVKIENMIWEALRLARIDEYIKSLPEQLETVIGEQGIKFSGGQRQRLALARALLSKPELLVLDEATASLDNETEEEVVRSIESLSGKITLIVIAHRLSTIEKCNCVYEVTGGTIRLVHG